MAPQDSNLFFSNLKHKILGKAVDIPANSAFQLFGLNSVQFSKVAIEHYLLAANLDNPVLYRFYWDYLIHWAILFHLPLMHNHNRALTDRFSVFDD